MAAKRASRTKRTSGGVSGKPVELSEVRERIKNLVGNAAVDMVENGIEAANEGHYAAMKFLFELVGLFPQGAGPEPEIENDGGLAKALLGRLGVDTGLEVTKVFSGKSVDGSDAVE